jgi:hypothetical protein
MNTPEQETKVTITLPGGEPREVTIDQLMKMHASGELPAETTYLRGGQWKPISQIITPRLQSQTVAKAAKFARPTGSIGATGYEEPGLVGVWNIVGLLQGIAAVIGLVMVCMRPRDVLAWWILFSGLFSALVCVTVGWIIQSLAEIAHNTRRDK